MILHVFSNTRNYPVEFANFAAAIDTEREHIFVFRSWAEPNGLSKEAEARSRKITTKRDLIFKLSPLLRRSEKVIFHSFTIGIALFYWWFAIGKVKSAWLAIYGTEIYWYKYARRTAWNRIQEYLRRRIFAKIGYVITIIDQDFQLFQSTYSNKASHVKAFVPIPGPINDLNFSPATGEPSRPLSLLLGNSATPTNHHVEMLQQLNTLPNRKNLRIICPLSYGDSSYADRVALEGRNLFGEGFEPLRSFLPASDYTEILYSVDLAVMNHDRQQALGNIFALLCIGKKVYIRGDNPAYDFFIESGIVVGISEEIGDDAANDRLVLSVEEAKRNHILMKKLLSKENYLKMWLPILTTHD